MTLQHIIITVVVIPYCIIGHSYRKNSVHGDLVLATVTGIHGGQKAQNLGVVLALVV